MAEKLSGQTAIITGSSQGIGNGIAERFAEEGANVVVNSRSQERAEDVATAIESTGGTAIGVEADVTNPNSMEALVQTTVETFGGLDVMVNNAGVTTLDRAEEFDIEEWRNIVDVDLNGTFIGCQVAGRRMIEQEDSGAILNMSSLMGGRGLQMRSPYCASKAGVNNLTRTLAVEWAEHDIYVNALAPGFIWTEITDQTQSAASYTDDDIRDRTPLNRFGTVEEMAECALFLVGRNNFVTGEVLYADGGWQAYGWGCGDQ
jgi:3-oxoacyl-[acyl-carrier protein] reductase